MRFLQKICVNKFSGFDHSSMNGTTDTAIYCLFLLMNYFFLPLNYLFRPWIIGFVGKKKPGDIWCKNCAEMHFFGIQRMCWNLKTPFFYGWQQKVIKCRAILKGFIFIDFDINFGLNGSFIWFNWWLFGNAFFMSISQAKAINVIDLQTLKNDLRVQRRLTQKKRCLGINRRHCNWKNTL